MSASNHPYTVLPAQRADAVLSQANPVSTTLYEVLPTTRNVRIQSIMAAITWAVTQPTPLDVVVTVDGQTIVYTIANPVTATGYVAVILPSASEANQPLRELNLDNEYRARSLGLFEGRSVRVQIRITWAVTQPTPLECRVKYAKY